MLKEGVYGGWEILLDYLSEKRFRDDVLNSEYTIVQIDTDICEHVNFNVPKETIPMMTFIEKIQERLILSIDKNKLFDDIILNDGKGNILSGYDGVEHEVEIEGDLYYVYRNN